MALSQADRDCGKGLMCMAKVTSDSLTIDFEQDNVLAKLPTPQENLPYVITEKLNVTETIARLRLRPMGQSLRFWPGQYIKMGSMNGEVPKRCYSIANTPNTDGEIVLYITKVVGGKTSSFIHENINAGDITYIDGPYGTFIGDPKEQKPVLCIANGSGLAPIMSLASAALLRGGFRYPAHIIFSARTEKDIFDLGIFKYLEKKHRNFKFIPTLTREKSDKFQSGRVTELLPRLYPNLDNYSLYIAGSNEFVTDVKNLCLNLGAKEENIHLEKFIS
jgi:CDP-4-dehydro-6-deoxyglucose reductase